ncbi:MAG: hypothetical protein KGQ73_09335 [Gammaproteobacteria bacterium]|nr:hypothetical protein [Gammaproteobacteria bacterium]
MRLQLQSQTLRLRIDEAELARLLAGDTLRDELRWPDGRIEQHQLALAARAGWHRDADGWCVALPDTAVRELAARLPSRDGLRLELPVPQGQVLQVLFDVDVRDSTRQRLPKHPHGKDAS